MIVSGGQSQGWDLESVEQGSDVEEALDHDITQEGFAIQQAARYAARTNDLVVSVRRINDLKKANERQ